MKNRQHKNKILKLKFAKMTVLAGLSVVCLAFFAYSAIDDIEQDINQPSVQPKNVGSIGKYKKQLPIGQSGDMSNKLDIVSSGSDLSERKLSEEEISDKARNAYYNKDAYVSTRDGAVKVNKEFTDILGQTEYGVSCQSAQRALFPFTSKQNIGFNKVKGELSVNNMPRCSGVTVSGWNLKVKKAAVICNSLGSLYAKLENICQAKTVSLDCMSVYGMLVKPCGKYARYFSYVLAGLTAVGAGSLLAGGFVLAGVTLALSALLLGGASVLAGLFSGWMAIIGSAIGFVVSLTYAIKGIFSIY